MYDELPLTADELIDLLDQRYPEVVFSSTESREEFLLRSGERRLVLSLLLQRQRERDDENVHE